MRSRALFLVLVLGLAASWAAVAQDKAKADARVTQQLDRLGIKYSVTSGGNCSVTYDLEGGRSQVVYVMGTTETYDGVEIRELWSRAGIFAQAPSADIMENLLEESGSKEIGFWSLEKTDDEKYILYFSVKVPVYLKDTDLSSLLEFTADVADQKEKELFNVDDE